MREKNKLAKIIKTTPKRKRRKIDLNLIAKNYYHGINIKRQASLLISAPKNNLRNFLSLIRLSIVRMYWLVVNYLLHFLRKSSVNGAKKKSNQDTQSCKFSRLRSVFCVKPLAEAMLLETSQTHLEKNCRPENFSWFMLSKKFEWNKKV